MNLVSLEFAVFLVILLFIYYLLPLKIRWISLLAGSWIFYFAYSVQLSFFLLLTVVTTFLAGKYLDRCNQEQADYLLANMEKLGREEKKQYKAGQTAKKRKIVLLAVLCNIGVLCVLKYTGFVFEALNQIIGAVGGAVSLPSISWLLPLGLSFYTFQAVGYVIDVYRGKYRADQNFLQYMLFVSFFPQIIQGPISRHDQLADQLYEGHCFDYTRFTMGLQLVLWGLIKKMVLADRLSMVSSQIFDQYLSYSGITMFVGAAVSGMQVYADFSGGMDMVRGISQMFGIELTLNFARPYFACSLAEFWRRWHITLGAWMRDYVFYPVSLSKSFSRLGKKTKKWFGVKTGKMIPTFLAMFLTFFLVGIWHGAQWKYVAYGLWNGIIISTSILLEPVYQRLAKLFHIQTKSTGWKLFSMVRTFVICSLGRYFSRGVSLRAALTMLKSTFTVWNPEVFVDGTFLQMRLTVRDYLVILVMLLALLVIGIWQERGKKIRESAAGLAIVPRWTLYLLAVLFLILFGMYGPGYLPAEFVYQRF